MRERFVTLVFLHGAGCTGGVFSEQMPAFWGALAPNLPGHEAPGSEDSIAGFARFVTAYIAERGLMDVVLCGHSMGAAIAMQAALDGALLRALVLIGSGGRMRVAPAFLDGLANDFPATARRIAGYFFAEPDPARVTAATEAMLTVGQAQTLRDFQACNAFDAVERLSEISVPVLALTGEHDALMPPKLALTLADRVPNGEARILQGAGHFVMAEQPAETNEAIRTFLSGIP